MFCFSIKFISYNRVFIAMRKTVRLGFNFIRFTNRADFGTLGI